MEALKTNNLFGLLFILLISNQACFENRNDNPDPGTNGDSIPGEYILGADLSYVNQVEDHGGIYKENDQITDPIMLFAEKGLNLVRIRLWHNPAWIKDIYGDTTVLYSGPADVLRTIKRAHEAGMKVLLNFHYSDIWADPGRQKIPVAWQGITDLNVLGDSVYNYTYKTLDYFYREGHLPEMVQIGNETNCGMMVTDVPDGFPNLNVCEGNWRNFGQVINEAISAVHDIETKTGNDLKVALHVADPKNLDWWMNDAINKGRITDFDIMGFSFYHLWHKTITFNELPGLVSRLISTYHKDLIVMETAYPFTTEANDNYNNIFGNELPPLADFPYSVQGQKDFLITLNQNMADAGALGVIYWEPAWITSNMQTLWGNGSAWENCSFFDYSGNVTEVVDYLGIDYK